ncbi:MAG: LamG domain-containing protein [Planctomycetota bacterium]
MEEKMTIPFLSAIVALFVLCGSVSGFSGAGSGTEPDPYVITTLEQLQEMGDDLGAYYVLGNDIDASATAGWNDGDGFVPVGTGADPFTGNFDGRGHSISNLHVDRVNSDVQGLFGLASGATLVNARLIDASVRGNYYCGCLAGVVGYGSVVVGCSATGTVTLRPGSGDSKSGGLMGGATSASFVDQCSSGVDVNADRRKQVGSLIGYLRGRDASPKSLLTNSYSYGTVTGSGSKQGNLVGDADGSRVDRCYSCGYGKALIGNNYASPVITNCYWDKDKGASSSGTGGSPRTTDQMMQQATFVGWDFVDIWDIVENETYPFLRVSDAKELVALEIFGPNEVAEDFHARYKAIAYYDNNSMADVTDSAVWSVEPNTIASIDAGLLTTGEIAGFAEDITVGAQYTRGEGTVDAGKSVNIFAVCPGGSALQFDGTNDYVNCGYDPSLNVSNQITVQTWIYPQANRWMGIVSKGDDVVRHDDYGLWFNSGKVELSFNWPERWGIYPAGDRFVGHTAVPLNQWSHFAGTWDGHAVRLYVNGQLDAEFPWTHGINSSGTELYFGVNPGGGDEYFKGIMDEVTILDRALSAEEIRVAMHTKLTGAEPNLIGCWDFDEGVGQIAYDLTANGNNGRLGSSTNPDSHDPAWVVSEAPVGDCPMPCAVDIKPGSCPNPVNVNSRGVVPVAILGSEDFDVTEVDPASIELAAVGAIRSSFEDVSVPIVDGNECDCTEAGPDGFTDLMLKFDTQEIAETLGEVEHGEVFQLALTGVLQDGTTIEGLDCVVIRGKHKPFNQGDLNKDGIVNIADFASMAQDWLESTVTAE